jgi:ATP-dependent RNA helicase DDX5/DBP2
VSWSVWVGGWVSGWVYVCWVQYTYVFPQAPVKAFEGPIVLVIAPVRELAQQIFDEFARRFPRTTGAAGIRTMCIYGGSDRRKQNEPLRQGIDVLVATPGRLIDEVSSGRIKLNRVTMVILDEADRMLDMGFEPQIRSVLGQIRPDRQMLLWSATWPRAVQNIAMQFMKTPVCISAVGGDGSLSDSPHANPKVIQKFLFLNPHERMDALVHVVTSLHPGEKTIIFCSRKSDCDEVADRLEAGMCVSPVLVFFVLMYVNVHVYVCFS